MRQILNFIIALCIAVIIVIAVHMFAFTIYTSPVTIGNSLRKGDHVVVNKFNRYGDFSRGELIVFTTKGEAPHFSFLEPLQEIGLIVAVPGNIITVGKERYRIPYKCCDRCQCYDCCLYLVDTGNGRKLVHKHQVVGKVY